MVSPSPQLFSEATNVSRYLTALNSPAHIVSVFLLFFHHILTHHNVVQMDKDIASGASIPIAWKSNLSSRTLVGVCIWVSQKTDLSYGPHWPLCLRQQLTWPLLCTPVLCPDFSTLWIISEYLHSSRKLSEESRSIHLVVGEKKIKILLFSLLHNWDKK